MAKEIPLQNRMVAVVDDEDYEKVSKYKWYLIHEPYSKVWCDDLRMSLCSYVFGKEKHMNVTHKNKDCLDNRKENLFIGNKKEVVQTQRGHRNSSSKYKGVSWNKRANKWEVRIYVDGKNKSVGRFTNENEAAKAYNRAALEYFGGHAFQNKIDEDNSAKKPLENAMKMKQRRNNGASGFKGVYLSKYTAKIWDSNKKITVHLGSFNTAEEAAKVYDKKAYEIYGDKAILNFPELVGEYRDINWSGS